MNAVHLVGAGGIGCAIGHTLRAAGASLVVVEKSPAKLAELRSRGIGVEGRGALSVEAVSFAEWRPPPQALVVLTTKCFANAEVLAKLPEGAHLLPVQNGVDAAMDAFVPRAEGVASFVSECPPTSAVTRITRKGDLHLGYFPDHTGRVPAVTIALVESLVPLLSRGPFRLRRVEDIRPYKYTKLLYNAAVSPLAAAAGLDNGELLRDPQLRRLFFALLRENQRIMAHAGVELAKIGPFHPATVARILSRPWLANLLARFFEPSLRGTYCSMAPDLRASREDVPRTETANYNGHLVELAGDLPCPLNRAVCEILARMDRERPTPSREWLRPLFALV